ncbi:hypothetical protein LYZ77_13095 [Xanthomonas hortorum pv. vitians]|nr:hypothetical protein [Xanthomonas hortorum]MCE4282938.1 hypothetical protein [Xanthomonas hortorum pv. vitians]MCE4285834.1 hypothetical protein [Xanthomonas hortorum pv. vitians]MCE4288424.1 hypothetical protein [Xanthomonas hortorum pv. vitians]MCE4294599.1 hypothetical protein [Xanthomonas hortorum pv. vitians]MDT7853213.1 hypothetical protein [Xanthomonas hortorum pv. vitians]
MDSPDNTPPGAVRHALSVLVSALCGIGTCHQQERQRKADFDRDRRKDACVDVTGSPLRNAQHCQQQARGDEACDHRPAARRRRRVSHQDQHDADGGIQRRGAAADQAQRIAVERDAPVGQHGRRRKQPGGAQGEKQQRR